MRKILLTLLLIMIACFAFGQQRDTTTKAEAKGVVLIDVYNDKFEYVGKVPLEFNVADTSVVNQNVPPISRKILVTYGVQNRWSKFTEIDQIWITSSNWYAGGNAFLHDFLRQLPGDVVDGIDNPKRKSITILHTGFLRPGTILSTKTLGWDKGLLFMGK